MAIRRYKVSCKGVSPILMHSCRGANPLDPEVRVLKGLTSKKGKTEDDHLEIAKLEYKINAYYKPELGFFLPATLIEATIVNGAKKNKKGKQTLTAVEVEDMDNKLYSDAPDNIDEAYLHPEFVDVRNVVVDRKRILRTRPRFDRWRVDFTIKVDESIVNVDEVIMALNNAGSLVGFGDFRPKYGRFEVTIEEIKEPKATKKSKESA